MDRDQSWRHSGGAGSGSSRHGYARSSDYDRYDRDAYSRDRHSEKRARREGRLDEDDDWRGSKRRRSRSPGSPPCVTLPNGRGPSSFPSAGGDGSHRHPLPPKPQASHPESLHLSHTSSPTLPGGKSAETEDEKKKREKRERIEAWKKKREAEKAAEEAKQRAQKVASTLTSSLPNKPGATLINATALKGLGARSDFAKGKLSSTTNSLADTADLPEKKEIKRFTLPPMDPLLKPAAGGKVGPNLESVDDEDEDEDEGIQPLSMAGNMDTAEDDEVDPLDAFMAGVSNEVKEVNEADQKRLGVAAGSSKDQGKTKQDSTVVGEDELSAGEDAGEGQEGEDELSKLSKMEDIIAAAAKSVKKRGLPQTDHSSVDYEPYRKAFYHPPAEIQEMTNEDAESLRLQLDAIAVRGKDCPKPLTKWSHCGLPASCLEIIKRLNYERPTPIQAQAIPAIMSGRDVIGVAKTGSGKTMAFLLPMFRHINDQRPVETMEGPVGLIMTPTRELAIQIYRESKPFLRGLGLRAVCVYGGVPISEQIAEMKKTAEIVVATPGRMIDLLTANSGRVTNLRRVTYLVLDEADRMFDMGFEPQVMNIVNNIRPDRQTVLFSATFPKQMESLARKVLKHRPLEITVGGKSVVAPEIEQIVEVREQDTKFHRLLEILGQTYNDDEDARTLIFVDRQEAADDLLRELMRKGYPTMSIHGGKDQVDRDSTIADFKAGVVPIVTATSIAARGLDVKQLKLVINYDVPNHLEDYVHRAGRTGRAGNKGTCVTFITPQQERYAKDIVSALMASKVAVPEDLQALANKFAEKVKSGKAQVAGSGFGGKGLERLENDREKALRAQKSAFGEGTGEDEKDKEDKVGKDGSAANAEGNVRATASSKETAAANEEFEKLNEMTIEVKKGPAPDFVRDNKVAAALTESSISHTATQQASMERALEAAKTSGADTTKLAQALAKIQAMHADKKSQLQKETERRRVKDPDATDFHAIIPINDFPQKARWRATNKETMSMLIESSGASITSKGAFYEKGKEPQPGEPPKLQLLIESNDPERIERAVRDIKLILLEATQAALEAEQKGPSGPGRYSVL
ncbi:P-loop containing nucleoside triphosphate hydrolase protein [Tilletiaria anomala UBC 951]|uniref:RNA helicase n=1 Tax=Tilletiaria anomala (strain ATCC 24038 / CBS 436.72 / UBC 951) TaxID=1037660 RepID=A0A066VUA1_TILAU|nr:P-loop containing nucleoside triphosphate hydrolase protein [Tilletiaria anomala UBC 951]KDN45076.1 P-loop containing nucleoside triphosphate hydrolase protein [Tilletiaria anomala UBC 951]